MKLIQYESLCWRLRLRHPTLIPPLLESSSKGVRLGTSRRVRRDFIGGADLARSCSKPVRGTKARGVCTGGGIVCKRVSGCLSDEEPISGGAFCIIALPHSGARRAPLRRGLELRLERRP